VQQVLHFLLGRCLTMTYIVNKQSINYW